jgi:monothiol glutaredoxin
MIDSQSNIQEQIKKEVETYPIILFMKGNKLMPQCGFSAQVVHVLQKLEVSFETRDILQDEVLRQGIKEYSDWPTIPQLYINNEFIGGCDIITELYENGKLKEMVASVKE